MDKMIVSGSTATTDDLEFFMTDTTDHVTGKTGLSPTVTIRKPGGAFGSPAGAVSEIAKGWYRVAANATDNNTNGALLLNATAAGADPSDKSFQVIPWNVYDGVRLGLTELPKAVAGASGGIVPIGTGANTFKSDASANVTFANTSIATVTNLTNAPTNGDLTAAMKTSVQTAADAAVTANATIIGINSKTTNLPASPAAVGSAMTLTVAYDAAKTASQAGDAMALTGAERTALNTVIKTTAITESYRANGVAPTEAQFMSEVLAHLGETTIAGTTKTIKKFDHSASAATFSLDSATVPTTISRAT